MRPVTLIALCATAVLSTPATATSIERACLTSDRPGASRAVCGCIQDAANLTLSTKDQRLAATFFRNPQKAQEIRKSDTREHDAFWERYRNFGQTAEAFCRN